MTCGSEESLIRIKISQFKEIKAMCFDLEKRTLTLILKKENPKINDAIFSLNLSCKVLATEETNEDIDINLDKKQSKILWLVLLINLAFFIIEMTTGLISKSMGLVADSLDMLSDSFVYAISLFAVGGTLVRKKRVTKLAGYFQIILAVLGFSEVIRRFLEIEQIPDFSIMIIVSIFALIANGISLYLMLQSKNKEEIHMKASLIFTSNDIIINLSVIVAGFIVMFTGSLIPDLIIACIVFVIVIRGAFRILKLS
ncbi:MAG: cation transporter [Bacteroidetes bacterium]|nr:MAG: cation transporter [Bacteroidota bacterium]